MEHLLFQVSQKRYVVAKKVSGGSGDLNHWSGLGRPGEEMVQVDTFRAESIPLALPDATRLLCYRLKGVALTEELEAMLIAPK